MGILLTVAGIYIPKFIRKKKVIRLFAVTAEAFETPMPSVDGLNVEECLREYAQFTKERAEEAIRSGREAEVKHRLHRYAFHMGTGLREEFGVRNIKETMRLARLVYDMVGIDFSGDKSGSVTIKRCYFSRYYPPEVCAVIASLDAGLLAGISGGGRLNFSHRLTEGNDCCQARLSLVVKTK